MMNGLKKAGWIDEGVIKAWAQGGPLYRLVSDSLDYIMSLLQHLMGLSTAGVPWSYVQSEIDHRVDEMGTICSIADSRLQAMVQLYCYLCDGHGSSWQSSSLQAARNVELCSRESAVPGTSDEGAPLVDDGYICSKCGTRIHGGNNRNCPWFKLPNKKAKLMAAKFMRGELGAGAPAAEGEDC
jgi:hypothetical protein